MGKRQTTTMVLRRKAMPIIEDLADDEDNSASSPAPDLHIGHSARRALPMTKRRKELLARKKAAAENPPVAPDLLPSSLVVTAGNSAPHVSPLNDRRRSSVDREAARKEYESAFNNGEYNVLAEGMTTGGTGSDHSMRSYSSSTGVRKSLTPPITPAAPAKRPAKRLLSRLRAMPIDCEPEISPRLMDLDFTTVDAAAHNSLPTRRPSTPHAASIEALATPMSSRSLNQLKQSLMVGSQCVTLKQSPRLLDPIDKSASPRLLADPTSLRSMQIRGIISKPRCDLLGSSCLPPIPAIGSAAG